MTAERDDQLVRALGSIRQLRSRLESVESLRSAPIAVVGMGCRLPGADDPARFWELVEAGTDLITATPEDRWDADAIFDPDNAGTGTVTTRWGGFIDGIDRFDAGFFGISPREAELMDPQQRLFLEVACDALEDGGQNSDELAGSSTGVFVGVHSLSNDYQLGQVGDLHGLTHYSGTGSSHAVISGRLSYLLDLRGPSVAVDTACSSSLVAIHQAIQSLRAGESSAAVVGGVNLLVDPTFTVVASRMGMMSPTGRCHPFDAAGDGYVRSDACVAVVLKRLDDALNDGDTIHAVVRGTAINNDGSNKVGFLAPSVDGQSAAISEAIDLADVDPESIGFIECHGTGTEIGDPIEVAALTQAFQAHTGKTNYCALGSVKTNIGHLDTAAGVAALIKACLALDNGIIPPTVHFKEPNPKIGFEGSPFFVNGEPLEWTTDGEPRRAGVSSLGVGGTNAHVILEEAPEADPADDATRNWQLLPLSAKGPTALDDATSNLADFLGSNADADLADVAFTLKVGRRPLDVRRFVVANDVADAAAVLRGEEPKRLYTGTAPVKDRSVVFMFPGQGAQYADMGRGLYESEAVYRDTVDECATILEPLLGLDLRTILFPETSKLEWANEQLAQTAITQPAIFVTEYAMARLWMSWGIQPTAMIGHSIGEYTAACLAEVFSLADALKVVTQRGRLMQDLPAGSMLAIPEAAKKVEGYLTDGLSLAAINGPEFSVVAGPDAAIDALQAELEGKDIAVRRLHTSHAFHSSMMDPMLEPFTKVVANTKRGEPKIPYVTNVTGTWVTAEQIDDPGHWAKHVRSAVDFVGGLTTILDNDAEPALLEVGPGRTLATFAKQVDGPHRNAVSTSMRHATAEADDVETALSTLGELWTVGAIGDWSDFHGDERRHRIPLPTYPFQHQEFWVDAGEHVYRAGGGEGLAKKADITDWFYTPAWNQTSPPTAAPEAVSRWLVLLDDEGLGQPLVERLGVDAEVVTVAQGSTFEASTAASEQGSKHFVINPDDPEHYTMLVRQLVDDDQLPDGVAYLWPLSQTDSLDVGSEALASGKVDTFYGQLFLAQALTAEGLGETVDWWTVSNNMHSVAGESKVHPLQALALGPVKVIGQEYPNLRCRNLDIAWPDPALAALVGEIEGELRARPDADVIALRSGSRWVQDYVAAPRPSPADDDASIKDGGTYLITGGTAGIGLEIAEHLASTANARLVLVSRTELPAREAWAAWLAEHPENDPTSRKLRRLSAIDDGNSAELQVVAADVTDAAQMRAVVAGAVGRFGGIDGVFHAAGHLADGLITMKERVDAESVLAAKVDGTLVLADALADVQPDFLALFSSVSAIAGTAGQIDYAAANAFLNAYARYRSTAETGVTVAIGWGPWQEVGMTVRTAIDLGLMDDAETMISTDHSLLDRWYEGETEDIFETDLATETHWLLDEHRALGGIAILPGTGYLDFVTAGFDQRQNGRPFEVSDLFFMAPFMVADGERSTLRMSLSRDDNDFVISSSVGGATVEHARGQVRPLDGDAPAPVDIEALQARCDRRDVSFDRVENPQLLWGPRWNNLRRMQYGSAEALASLQIPDAFLSDLADHRLHPAVLDLATGGAQDLIEGFATGTDFFVPFSYGRLRHHAPMVEQMYSHIRYRQGDDPETAVFDITMLDMSGAVLVEIESFVMRRAVGEIADVVATDADVETKAPILESIENGIATDEGMQALRRVLSGRQVPEVAVVSQDLHALIQRSIEARNTAGDADGGTGISHDRPDVSTPFVEPTSERELAIASIWEEMLGVRGVGVHDDFFELGGHSLLLTQAITRIKKLTSADVSLFTLFEASTISELIVEIEKAEAEEEASGGVAAPKLGRVSRDKYRTQVGALQGKEGTR